MFVLYKMKYSGAFCNHLQQVTILIDNNVMFKLYLSHIKHIYFYNCVI